MGLKKWLGMDLSASQPPPRPAHQPEDADARRRASFAAARASQEPPRRRTDWKDQQQQQPRRPARLTVDALRRSAASTDSAAYVDAGDARDNDTMNTMVTALQSPPRYGDAMASDSDSDVSAGADDDEVADRRMDVRSTAAMTRAPAPALGGASSRFSWLNVLGASSHSEFGQSGASAVAQAEEVEEAAQRAKEGVDRRAAKKHDPDVDVRPQDGEMGVVMQGWLEKCGQQFKTWNWRFFVLRDDCVLSYYADETLQKLKGSLAIGAGSKADISVQSNLLDKRFVFLVATRQRNLMISAPSQRTMTKWIARLHAAGAQPTQPWDPLRKTVKFYVRDSQCAHEWKRYDDPTSYIHMEGCLLKRGHVNKNWKNRFFRIEKGQLRYYTESQSELKGSVALKDTIVSPGMAQCPDGRQFYFVLTSRDGKFEMHLNAHNESDMHLWIEALQEAQTALGNMAGKDTVAGLALVVKRAEEIPLAKVQVRFKRPEDIGLEMQKRTEALVVTASPGQGGVPVGSQLIAVEGHSVLRQTYAEARATLRASTFPLRLEFLLPPFKRGVLIKKSRSGFENWKERVVVVTNGEIRYYKQVAAGLGGGRKAAPELKHRKSFSLYGCYLNLVQVPGRDLCIVVARSPSDKLVLQTRSEHERLEWASVIYCSIRMGSQGITSGHIEHLQLEKARVAPEPRSSDLVGSFRDKQALAF